MTALLGLVAGATDWQPVVVALAALIVASTPGVASYFKSLSNGQKLDAIKAQTDGVASSLVAHNAALAAKLDAIRTAPVVEGGAGQKLPNLAQAVPLWDQLRDPNPDGAADRFSTTDCGEECVCMVARACRGVVVAAGDARYQLGGADRPGITSAQDLVTLLTAWHFRPAVIEHPAAATRAAITPLLAAGHPVIALGEWITAGVLHWVVLTGINQGYVHFADPWHGQRRSLAEGDWDRLYRGVCVDAGEGVRPL